MALNPRIVGIGNWIFRTAAMREVRGRAAKLGESAERAVSQVRLLIEVARRVVEPADALPPGSRPAVLLSLYRDAAYWMLVAIGSAQGVAPDLATLWTTTPSEKLLKAAGDADALAKVRSALVEQSAAGALTATDEDVERARVFVESLLWEHDAPNRQIDRVHLQRWTRIGLLAAVCLVVALGVRTLVTGPDLAAGKPFRTSSSYPECTAPNKCADIFFHTQPQDNPWLDYDLGTPQSIHRVEVTNRSDCCADRAVPLIIETSLDDKQWTEAARQDAQFSNWTAKFSTRRARYVRLRVPRNTVLHFDHVAIR